MLNTGTGSNSWRHMAAVLILFAFMITILETPSAVSVEKEQAGTRIWPDNLYGVDFVNKETGWISGYAGTVLRTANGGQSWDLSHIGYNELIRNISFVDTQYGWAVGNRGSIFHTTDGGEIWTIQHSLSGTYLRDIQFIDRNTGWAVGHDATILHTTDGGQSWRTQKLIGYKGRDLPHLHGIVAVDSDNAFVVGEFGVMAATSDGGNTWPIIKSTSRKTLLSVARVKDHFIAVGLDGVMARIALNSDNEYEIEWLHSGTDAPFFSIGCCTSGGTAIAVGQSVVVRIDGEEVSKLSTDKSIALPFTWFGGVDVLDDGTCWMAGIRGAIAKGDIARSSVKLMLNIGSSKQVKPAINRGNGSQ